MREKGLIVQLSRGLYQLPEVEGEANHELAEAAKLVPKGVICLVSALAFHQLTDTIPPRVWVAIGSKDRRPAVQSRSSPLERMNLYQFGVGQKPPCANSGTLWPGTTEPCRRRPR